MSRRTPGMRWLARWRAALRIARRDAWKHKGRSAVVLVMVALPVLVVVAGDTLVRTASVSDVEGLDRQIGASDALVYPPDSGPAQSLFQDPSARNFGSAADSGPQRPAPTVVTLRSVLGPTAQLTTLAHGEVVVRARAGLARVGAVETALRSSAVHGLFRLTDGRLPRSPDEVAVTSRLAGRGAPVGSTLRVQGGSTLRVVGQVESTTTRETLAAYGFPGSLGLAAQASGPGAVQQSWLVRRSGGVPWSDVQALNAHGLLAVSRLAVTHPPSPSQLHESVRDTGNPSSGQLTIVALIAAMALLEVVLLAGPAFAVGTRRQERALALMVATGGRAKDVRRTVLGGGVVLGGAAALLGAAGGVLVARVAQPAVQLSSTTLFGPFQVSLRDIAGIALFGFLSAVLAALAPAVLAARLDVVAVLASRRGQTRAGRRSPAVGALLLGGGVALAAYGVRGYGSENAIVLAAILAVLGMVLLVPLVVAQLGRFARPLPLALRFAVRDAARHRRRTSPAVAAVAATVAGVVALGIGASSDAAEARATYSPNGPAGAAVVRDDVTVGDATAAATWSRLADVARAQLPGATVHEVRGYRSDAGAGRTPAQPDPTSTSLDVAPVNGSGREPDTSSYFETLGSSVLVGQDALDRLGLTISVAERAAARRALASGGAVVLGYLYDHRTVTGARLTLSRYRSSDGNQVGDDQVVTVPGTIVHVPGLTLPAQAVLSEAALRKLGLAAATVSLVVDGVPISKSQEDALSEAVRSRAPDASVYVERGYHDNSTAVALLLLTAVGAVLLVGGTLTATFLALSDARPDFATLGAIGAAPRTRRAVAASYAAVIGLVGGALGAVVGFVPGIAVTYPLTSARWQPEGSTDLRGVPLPSHFLDVPWLLVVGLVVLVPLVIAAVVGLTARSRLPMVSRLS